MEDVFLFVIELVGTVAFAISGIRLAAAKEFDWFGAYTIGLVTAIGGGTLRDLLLDAPVFWMQNPFYFLVTGISLAIVIIFRKMLVQFNRTLFIFDAIGLAMFVVVGIQKSIAFNYPMWVAITMGMITGSFGGVTRDILINEEPLFFRKDIYATACIAGGIFYAICFDLGMPIIVSQMVCAFSIIGLRVCALRYNWALPTLRYERRDSNPELGRNVDTGKKKN